MIVRWSDAKFCSDKSIDLVIFMLLSDMACIFARRVVGFSSRLSSAHPCVQVVARHFATAKTGKKKQSDKPLKATTIRKKKATPDASVHFGETPCR